MRIVKSGCFVILFIVMCVFSVKAQTVNELYREQLEASGAEELLQALPEETRVLLERLHIDSLDPDSFAKTDTGSVLNELWTICKRAAGRPLAACGMVLGILLVYAWVEGMRHTLRTEEVSSVFGVICALAACGSVMLPLSDQLQGVCEAMESVSVFTFA